MGTDLWEQGASWWQTHYTDGADPEYEEQILPMVQRYARGGRLILDIGCGEGQVSRRLAEEGAAVVGLDPTGSQIRSAVGRGGSARFLQARAESLPCGESRFDTVVLCLAIEHGEPFEAALKEVSRVLAPGGRFLFLLVHPLLQAPGSGWVEVVDSDARFWRVGSYLADDIAVDEVAPGVSLPFIHRPLSRYIHVMGTCGLLVDDMVEPTPPPETQRETAGFTEASSIPRLLLLCARKVG
jgi:SAM-dependent methyltransferase